MKIFYALLYLGVFLNAVDSTNWMDNLVRHIVKNSRYLQLRVITNFDEKENLKNPVVEDIIVKLMNNMPTVRINFGKNLELPVNLKASHMIDARFPIDTTATLFFLVIETHDDLPIATTKKFIDAVAEMASYHYSPKYLVIISVSIRSYSFEELLEYAWNQRLLSFTILELSQLKMKDDRSALPIIHQLNLFKAEYTRINWTGKVDNLFPKKVDNMWGHPLRIRAVNVPPFSIAKFNEDDEPIKIEGHNMKVIKMMAERLNASIKWIPPMAGENLYNINDPYRGVYSLMELQKIDIESYLSPQYSVSTNNSLRTTSVLVDRFCAIVPIFYRSQVPFPIDICKAYLLGFVLITTFWLLGKLLRFNNSFWKTFRISRVLFFVPVRTFPKANTERIIFGCLLATSGIISTNIYTSFTDISLKTIHEKEFNTFADLDYSGLIPIIGPFLYNKTFANAKGTLLNLKNKAIMSVRSRHCPAMAAKYKNVTCCLAKLGVDLKAGSENKRKMLKIAEPCFWYDSLAFTIGKRSPYRSHFNYIIWNLHSSGFIKNWYEERKPPKWSLTKYEAILEKRHYSETLRVLLLAIIFVGFTISLLVFLVEILIHSVRETNAFPSFGVFRSNKNQQWRLGF